MFATHQTIWCTCICCYINCSITWYMRMLFIIIHSMLFNWHQITAHLPSPPGCSADLSKLNPSLLSALFQGFCSLLPSLTQQFLSPYLCFSHKYLSWLPSLVAPHPRADFKQPAASSSVRTSVCYCHLTKANAMLKCLVLVASNNQVMRPGSSST